MRNINKSNLKKFNKFLTEEDKKKLYEIHEDEKRKYADQKDELDLKDQKSKNNKKEKC